MKSNPFSKSIFQSLGDDNWIYLSILLHQFSIFYYILSFIYLEQNIYIFVYICPHLSVSVTSVWHGNTAENRNRTISHSTVCPNLGFGQLDDWSYWILFIHLCVCPSKGTVDGEQFDSLFPWEGWWSTQHSEIF